MAVFLFIVLFIKIFRLFGSSWLMQANGRDYSIPDFKSVFSFNLYDGEPDASPTDRF